MLPLPALELAAATERASELPPLREWPNGPSSAEAPVPPPFLRLLLLPPPLPPLPLPLLPLLPLLLLLPSWLLLWWCPEDVDGKEDEDVAWPEGRLGACQLVPKNKSSTTSIAFTVSLDGGCEAPVAPPSLFFD